MAEQRDRWSTRTAFIMAAVGSAVGLGNVWRFPYVAYKYGGGAFFIPYFVALLTAGIPLMILEFGLGQKMQASAPSALGKANKHTEWVGWFALLVGTVISCYYAAIMAYAVEYLLYSVKGLFAGGQMPWNGIEGKFFTERVRNHSTAAGEMWKPVWHLALALVAVWGAVFWIIYKGVKRVGKVVMWTVPLPVILLLILTIRGLTLPGAGDGILYYLTPDFTKLGDPATWLAAYGQVFFSLSIGFGIMIAYASYRPTRTWRTTPSSRASPTAPRASSRVSPSSACSDTSPMPRAAFPSRMWSKAGRASPSLPTRPRSARWPCSAGSGRRSSGSPSS